jgi:hypothetical protein
MLITSRDRLEPRAGEHAYALRISLPAHRDAAQDAALSDHIDSFVRLYLTRFQASMMRASRTGPLRWALVSQSQKMDEVEKVRAELETTLFGANSGPQGGQIVLVEMPVEDDVGDYVPATSSRDEQLAGTAATGTAEAVSGDEPLCPPTLEAELAAFRADMREIAASLSGADVKGALSAFRSDLDALALRLESGVSEAAGRVEGAAERLDLVTARLPDADRLELALTRNDASAALIASGLQESLKLLVKAVEGLERQSAQSPVSGAARDRAAA